MARIRPPSHIEEAVHVVPGDSAAGSLACCGVEHLIVLGDRPFPGPCDPDPATHLEKRRAYLRTFMDYDPGGDSEGVRDRLCLLAAGLLGAEELAGRLGSYVPVRPVVLWTTSTWADRLIFWRVLDALERAGSDCAGFWAAEPGLPRGHRRENYHPPPMLGSFHTEEHQAAFEHSRPLGTRVLRAGATMWRKFASVSPLEFDAARRKGSPVFPDLGLVSEVWGAYFPRLVGRDRLMLSLADQALLEALRPDRWLCPLDVIRGERMANLELIDCFVGEHFLDRRLREWAAHPGRPAVLARAEPGGGRYMDASYRLTRHGERLREWGWKVPRRRRRCSSEGAACTGPIRRG
jgi:hypothetical protein